MTANFNNVYEHLKSSVVRTHGNWKLLVLLFGEQNSLDLFNDTDPVAATSIHNALVEKAVLDIAKLRDPATSGSYENLSLRNLISKLKAERTELDFTTVDCEIDTFLTATEPFVTLRNKTIAHSDSVTLLSPTSTIAGISRSDIDSVMSQTESIMNNVEQLTGRAKVHYSDTIMSGGGSSLVASLQHAKLFLDINDLAVMERPDVGKIVELAKNEPPAGNK